MHEILNDFISQNTIPSLCRSSRIHRLNSYIAAPNFYVKREDELSSGVIGSKWRKYLSLLHFLNKHDYKHVSVVGSENSNNIISLLQLLNEFQIRVTAYLLESHITKLCGNALWLRLLCQEENIVWVKRQDWPEVLSLVKQQTIGKHSFVIPEGANTVSALPGTMTLTLDILQNEQQQNIFFDHIFTDSGTGFSSIAMILAFWAIGEEKRDFYITLLAGTKEEYLNYLRYYHHHLQVELRTTIQTHINKIYFHRPVTAKSFGTVNNQVFTAVKNIALQEGILVDPIYSAKHFLTVADIVKKQKIIGNSLLIYNGGSFALSGFQEKLRTGFF